MSNAHGTARKPGGLSLATLFRQWFRSPSPAEPRHQKPAPRDGASAPRVSPALDLGDLGVAQVVHDMRNQLAVVLMSAECLRYRVPAGDASIELEDLRRAAERASTLTHALLTVTHGLAAARVPIDVNLVAMPIVETLERLAGKEVHVNLRTSTESAWALATPAEIERLLLNLALNALDAMPHGGVLTIDTAVVEHVRDEADGPEPHVRLRVSDTGWGMPPEVKARILEPLFTTKARSTGMGLSSVAFTVRQLHGRLFVESEPGAGTRATVLLPCAAPQRAVVHSSS